MTATNYRVSLREGTISIYPGSMLYTSTSIHAAGTAPRVGHVIRASDLDEFLFDAFEDPEIQFVAVWDQNGEGAGFNAQYKRVDPTEVEPVSATTVSIRDVGDHTWAELARAQDDLASGIAAVLDTLRRQYPGLRFESEVTR